MKARTIIILIITLLPGVLKAQNGTEPQKNGVYPIVLIMLLMSTKEFYNKFKIFR